MPHKPLIEVPLLYILDAEGEAQPCRDSVTWAKWFDKADRVLARHEIGPYVVLTMFMGVRTSGIKFADWFEFDYLWQTNVYYRGRLVDDPMMHERHKTKIVARAFHDSMVQRVSDLHRKSTR